MMYEECSGTKRFILHRAQHLPQLEANNFCYTTHASRGQLASPDTEHETWLLKHMAGQVGSLAGASSLSQAFALLLANQCAALCPPCCTAFIWNHIFFHRVMDEERPPPGFNFCFPQVGSGTSFWLGFTKVGTSPTTYTNGTRVPAQLFSWYPGQPDSTTEQCVRINTWAMYDDRCTNQYSAICTIDRGCGEPKLTCNRFLQSRIPSALTSCR